MVPGSISSEHSFQDLELAGQDGGHVEAQLIRRPVGYGGQPTTGQPPEPGLLGPGDGLGREAKGVSRAGLDLAKDQGAAPPDDQIDLARVAPPVAGQDLIAVRLVPGGGGVLAGIAEATPGGGR
jgi:hypothetical protein